MSSATRFTVSSPLACVPTFKSIIVEDLAMLLGTCYVETQSRKTNAPVVNVIRTTVLVAGRLGSMLNTGIDSVKL